MISTPDAIRLIEQFDPALEELKSRELILALLEHSDAPFSRHQFNPGHVTCSSVVLDPARTRVLLTYHHRFRRWLLPGGHVEETDAQLADTAGRETLEETTVQVARTIGLVGVDVHGIPARKRKGEPFHLHHDLIFAFEAESDKIAPTAEAPQVAWCRREELGQYELPPNILRAFARAAFTFV